MKRISIRFIWQFSLYNLTGLSHRHGRRSYLLTAANSIKERRPRFSEPKKIANTILVGNLELHIKSSDCSARAISLMMLRNLILHVVL